MNKYEKDAYDRIALNLTNSRYRGYKIVQIGIGYKVTSLNGFTQGHGHTVMECKRKIDVLVSRAMASQNRKAVV